jgi:hypothetical protein
MINQINRATRRTISEIKIVEANGKEKMRPNSLKRTSPGKRPMPNFSSHGNKAEKIINAKNITSTQRII